MNRLHRLKKSVGSFADTQRSISIQSIVRQIVGERKSERKVVEGKNLVFFVNKHNSLSQRIALELATKGHNVDVCEINNGDEMVDLAYKKNPDVILCPFLTKRVPEDVCVSSNYPCLIVHPGIEGDRGMSSIDWAIKNRQQEWGVTILQAVEEMDAGDIWSTNNFSTVRDDPNTLTKSSMYVHEVTNAAVKGSFHALDNFINGVVPQPLNYNAPGVHGRLMPKMKKADRMISWEEEADKVALQVRMSDSSPGAVAKLRNDKGEWSREYRAFGAWVEESGLQTMKGNPGEIIGQRNNAILVKCGRGAVWLSHLKRDQLKLPATFWLPNINVPDLPSITLEIPYQDHPRSFQEIWTSITPEGVCFVNFNFYNGAMSTQQCKRLESVLKTVEMDNRCKAIVLKGGYNFFSNGIHLNVIEHAKDPATESWRNINAINDVVEQIYKSQKLTISALQGNAGAGGVMMALASDYVLARDGVVLNPHYKQMHLYGSEYHTYFLPKRVGKEKADEILNSAKPILASDAVNIGMLDSSIGENNKEFHSFVYAAVKELVEPLLLKEVLNRKKAERTDDWMTNLDEHRRRELSMMAKCFQNQNYHDARKAFVYH